MKALCWYGKDDVRVETVPDPQILNPRDAIIKITTTAICGSDLHLYNGYIPTMEKGDILGHEFMGEVVELGSEVKNLKIGDRVVVPFTIACGNCYFCKHEMWSLCDNSNPNAWYRRRSCTAIRRRACSDIRTCWVAMPGGRPNTCAFLSPTLDRSKFPDGLADEQVLFLSDIFPTGYMAAENCNIQPGDTVAIWGAGPVGQFAIKSAYLLGAERVIAIDRIPERLQMAKEQGHAEVVNFDEVHVLETLKEMTGGRGPDACIDAVGLEAHGASIDALVDRVKAATFLATDRPHVLRETIMACRKGGTVSIPGVYGGFLDKIPMGAAFGKGLTFKMGQTHMHATCTHCLNASSAVRSIRSFVITHRMSLDDAPKGYETFKKKQDSCIKVILKP